MLQINTLMPYLNNVKQSGASYIAACPVCGDDHHLYVTPKDSRLLMYCQKCNAQYPEIVKAFGIPPKAKESKTVMEKYDHVYKYADSSVAYYKTRKKFSDGSKNFSFWYQREGKRQYTKPENAIVLYNHDLMEQADASERLFIVEGEKCADASVKAGLLATSTNTGGGNRMVKFTDEDRRLLDKFIDKVVITDNDETGAEYPKHFPDARVLNMTDFWPECPRKGDIADYLSAGLPLERVTELAGVSQAEPAAEPSDDLDVFGSADIKYPELSFDDIIQTAVYEYIDSFHDPFRRTAEETRLRGLARKQGNQKDFDKMLRCHRVEKAKKREVDRGFMTSFTGQPLQLHCGNWITSDNGIIINEYNSYGNPTEKSASDIPVMPVAILENITTGIEKVVIAYRQKFAWRKLTFERLTISSVHKILELANRGIPVTSESSKQLVRYLSDVLSLNQEEIPRHSAVSTMGWVEREDRRYFMPYDKALHFDGEEENRYLYKSIHDKGSFDTWLSLMRELRENKLFRLTMAASFASPLIELCHGLPFVFHLWGGTGSGKTVALMAAMSIWGNPAMGKMVRTMNMTANSMMATAAFLNSLPFAGDELQTIKSRWENYDRLVMSVTEGIDRGRMTYDRVNETKSWKCAFLFTGEEPCAKSSSGGGVRNRIIEAECTEPLVKDGNRTVSVITEHYGHAGQKFIEYIRNQQDIYIGYQAYFKKILQDTDTTEKQAMAMAFLLTADVLAGACFFPDEKPLTIEDVRPYLSTAKEVDVAERAYEFTVNLVARNINRFGGLETGEVWGRLEHGGQRVIINRDVLVKELSAEGYDFDAVKKKWAENGYIEKTNRLRLIHWTTYEKVSAWCVILNMRET